MKEPFVFLKVFLNSNIFDIRIATVESLSYIFDKHWIMAEDAFNQSSIRIKDFYLVVFDALKSEQLAVNANDDEDVQDQNKSTRIQLYGSCIANSFALRNRCLFLLTSFAYKIQLNQGMFHSSQYLFLRSYNIYNLLFLFTDTDVVLSILKMSIRGTELSSKLADVTKEAIPFLIFQWILNNCHISNFPWYLTNEPTIHDFIMKNKNSIAVAVLKHRPEFWSNLLDMLDMSEPNLLGLLDPEDPVRTYYINGNVVEPLVNLTFLFR